MKDKVYTVEQWALDRCFKAQPMQEVESGVYYSMLGDMTPAYNDGCTYLCGEPHSHDKDGNPTYAAFAMKSKPVTDGKEIYHEFHYYFLGYLCNERKVIKEAVKKLLNP